MTKRAKKRVGLLIVLLLLLVSGGWIAFELREIQKQKAAATARDEAAVAIARGDWAEALSHLSKAAAGNQDDVALIIELADLRSRVTELNNQHISTALRFYRDALAKARSSTEDDAEQLQIAALKGCAEMELALGQLARATGSCEQILEIDPRNTDALQVLVAVKTVVGDHLPDSTELTRRDGRSLEQWLDACRAASDSSALRWRLELLNQDPESVELVIGLVSTIREGKGRNRQELGGTEPEAVEVLIQGMLAEDSFLNTMLPIFVAEERLRTGDREGAVNALQGFDESKIDDPGLKLTVVYLYDRLDSPELNQRRNALLSELSSTPPPSAEMALQLARRYWATNRLENSLEAIRAWNDTNGGDHRVSIMGAIVASQLGDPSLETWMEVLERDRQRSDLSISARDQVQVALRLLKMKESETLDRAKVKAQLADMGRWFQDPVLMTLAGDIAAEAGFDSAAISAYESALQATGEASIISRRLVSALTRANKLSIAFRRAAEYANSSQSLTSFLVLGDAWIRLSGSGVDASEVVPEFDRFQSPVVFLEQIAEALETETTNSRVLKSLLIRAEMAEGNLDKALDRFIEYLDSAEDQDDLASALSLAISEGIVIPASVLEAATEGNDNPRVLSRAAILKATALAATESASAGVDLLRSRLEVERDSALRRELAIALAQVATDDPDQLEEASRLLGQEQLDRRDLILRIEIAIGTKNRALARELVMQTRREFGTPSVQASLAEGMFVLAFDVDDADSIAKALANADEVFSSGEGSPRLAAVLARLYLAGSPPRRVAATEVLADSVARYPANLSNLLFLVTELQQSGRFGPAAEYLDMAVGREGAASAAQRRFLVTLLGRQGDSEEARRVVCEIAAKTGDTADLLACMRLLYQSGDIAAGDEVLDQLAAKLSRNKEIDLALTDRIIREEGLESGIAFLEGAPSFSEEINRAIEVANRLMEASLFVRAIERLAKEPAEAFDSAEAQLLMAICHTRIAGGDPLACQAMLDRVLELQPDDVNYVAQVLNLMLATPTLRPEVPRYLPRLERLNPILSELVAIRIAMEELSGVGSGAASLADRAEDVIEVRPDILAAWSLLIDLKGRLYAEAVALGKVGDVGRIREEMLDLRFRYLQRFPRNSTALARAIGMSLGIGDLEEAELLARELSETSSRQKQLGTELPIAQVMFAAGDWDEASGVLAPFEAQILSPNAQVPIAFEILMTSKLATGRVDEAFANLQAKFAIEDDFDDVQEARWFGLLGNERVPSSARLEGVRIFEEKLGSVAVRPAVKLAIVETLLSVAREMKDNERILEDISRRLAAIDATGDRCLEIQLQGIIFEFEFVREPKNAISSTGRWLGAIPREFIEEVSRTPQLEGEMQERLALCYRSVVILLNNFLARFGEASLEGSVLAGNDPELAPIAAIADKDLASLQPFNPDVLDTRATYMLSRGRLSEALELANLAVSERPGDSRLRLTLARIMLAMGQTEAASEMASVGAELERIKMEADAEVLDELRAIRDAN